MSDTKATHDERERLVAAVRALYPGSRCVTGTDDDLRALIARGRRHQPERER